MGTVQTYLGKWGEKWILATPLPKLWEKVGERREKKKNFGNGIAKKKKKFEL